MTDTGSRAANRHFLAVFFKEAAISFIRANLPKGFRCVYVVAPKDKIHSDQLYIYNKEEEKIALIFADGSQEDITQIHIFLDVLDRCDLAERGRVLGLLHHLKVVMGTSFTFV